MSGVAVTSIHTVVRAGETGQAPVCARLAKVGAGTGAGTTGQAHLAKVGAGTGTREISGARVVTGGARFPEVAFRPDDNF